MKTAVNLANDVFIELAAEICSPFNSLNTAKKIIKSTNSKEIVQLL